MLDTEALCAEFGSLDSSLVLAIASEQNDLQSVRTTLKALALSSSYQDSDLEALTSAPLSRTESNATTSDVERTLEQWSLHENDGYKSRSTASSESGDHPYDANIIFLESMYPSRDRKFLRDLLQEHDGDVEPVLDHLLNIDYLDGETPVQVIASSDNAALVNEHRKRKRRRPPKSTTTFSLTDSGRLLDSPASSTDSLPLPAQSDNPWVTVDSMSSYIASLLDLSPGFVASIYHKKSSSFALTLDTLLDTLELKHPYDTLDLATTVLDDLKTMFAPSDPSAELAIPEKQWRKYLCATQGNVEHSIDLMLLQQEIHAREGSAVQVGLLKGFDTASREHQAQKKDLDAVARGVLRPDLPGWSVASASASGNRPIVYNPQWRPKYGNGTPVNLVKSRITEATLSDNPTTSECFAMAEEYRNNRNEAFKAAARHFQSGKSGGERGAGDRGAAAYWSEKGRELDARARTWDLRAARAQVAERRIVSDNSIDLHNLTVNQALTVVKENVNTWWSSSPNPRPFRIVTGAGRHSANRMPVLLPSVYKMLEREGWRVRKDPDGGSLIVTGLKSSGRTLAS